MWRYSSQLHQLQLAASAAAESRATNAPHTPLTAHNIHTHTHSTHHTATADTHTHTQQTHNTQLTAHTAHITHHTHNTHNAQRTQHTRQTQHTPHNAHAQLARTHLHVIYVLDDLRSSTRHELHKDFHLARYTRAPAGQISQGLSPRHHRDRYSGRAAVRNALLYLRCTERNEHKKHGRNVAPCSRRSLFEPRPIAQSPSCGPPCTWSTL